MNEKKIVVPDGMLKAVNAEWRRGVQLLGLLEAALRWLSEHPVVPTDDESRTLLHFLRHRAHAETTANDISLTQRIVNEWQRIMFRAERREMHPILKEWLADAESKGVDTATKVNYIRLFERAFEAGAKSNTK
jgi:hypothetical protein